MRGGFIMPENDVTRNGGHSHGGNATTVGMWDGHPPKGSKGGGQE